MVGLGFILNELILLVELSLAFLEVGDGLGDGLIALVDLATKLIHHFATQLETVLLDLGVDMLVYFGEKELKGHFEALLVVLINAHNT